MANEYDGLFADVVSPPASVRVEAGDWTAEQRSALELAPGESAVITAGAGSGKTKLLVGRACELVRRGVAPGKIALVSYTRKSAEQLKERLALQLGRKRNLPICTTLHALALKYCARTGPVRLMQEEMLDTVIADVRASLGDTGGQLSDKDIALLVSRHRELRNFTSTFGIAARHWMDSLAKEGFEDFTSLIERAQPLPADLFSHLLIDESQDLSPVQLQFIERISAPKAATWFVGDDDQSIFLFRGAGNATMHKLAKETPNARALTLNWRCAQNIVRAANQLMRAAPGRPVLDWQSARAEAGNVQCLGYATKEQEILAALHFAVGGPNRMVLARTQRELEPFKERSLKCSTVHEAKGLEWDSVWLLGCNEGTFPHALCDAEEERRLFYVAMTRARNDLTLSFSLAREAGDKRGLKASRFVFDAQCLTEQGRAFAG